MIRSDITVGLSRPSRGRIGRHRPRSVRGPVAALDDLAQIGHAGFDKQPAVELVGVRLDLTGQGGRGPTRRLVTWTWTNCWSSSKQVEQLALAVASVKELGSIALVPPALFGT
jgi:hypothetical protein